MEVLRPQDILKVCVFGPTLSPIYPMKECEIEKSKYLQGKNLSIRLSEYPQIKALSGLNFEWKIQLLFVVFGVFGGANMGPKRKDQEVRGQVNTPFSEVPPRGLTSGERISVVALGKLALFQPLFWLWARFWGATSPRWKKINWIFGCRILSCIFWKKNFSKNLQPQKSSPDLENFR